MTETTTAVEETADEIKPFVDEQDREIAYRSDSNPGAASSETARPAVIAPGAATGRRKEAIARVRIIPGSGQWTINGRTLEDYFPNKVHQQWRRTHSRRPGSRAPTMSSPASTAAALPARPGRCVSVSPGP